MVLGGDVVMLLGWMWAPACHCCLGGQGDGNAVCMARVYEVQNESLLVVGACNDDTFGYRSLVGGIVEAPANHLDMPCGFSGC
jgi:hypothetical protein